MSTVQAIAGGVIGVNRFISVGAADDTVIESNSGDTDVVGVSQGGSQSAPNVGVTTEEAAEAAGDPIAYYPYGSECRLEAGAGGLTRGGWAKPDNDGKGVAGSAGDACFFIPMQSASAGELALGICMPFSIPA